MSYMSSALGFDWGEEEYEPSPHNSMWCGGEAETVAMLPYLLPGNHRVPQRLSAIT